MDFDLIKSEIEQIKKNQKFEEKVYLKILNDLEELYKEKNNSYLPFTSTKYILDEKKNFRKYLIGSLLQNANNEAKNKNFQVALGNIKKLESLKPENSDVKKEIYSIKQFCEISINLNQGEILLRNELYREAINFYKFLKANSNTVIENDAYNRGLELSKAKYITSISNEIINLLPKKHTKTSVRICQKIIEKCEALFKECQFDNKLKSKISEIKKTYYSIALEEIIERKLEEENMTFSNEMDKYKALIDTENIKDNKLEEFKLKARKFEEPKCQQDKNLIMNSNDEINDVFNYEFNYISLETINNYLNIIKNINEDELDPNLEKDIITQINNYNKELNNLNKKQDNFFNDWIAYNNQKIKNNNFRGNIFAYFNAINKSITGFEIHPIQLISLLFFDKK